MRIVTLMENTALEGFSAEHGLSLYIETGDHRILFDAGQTGAFAGNARRLGIDLGAVDIAILSHGHYDHGGGLARFLECNGTAPVYLRREAFGPHYNGQGKYIGLDPALRENPRLIFAEDGQVLAEGISLHSCNDRKCPFPADHFDLTVLEGGQYRPDGFRHEHYLLIEEAGKKYLFSGCSHKGILNIAAWFRPDVLVGGFHFKSLDPVRDREALSAAARVLAAQPTVYYTGHCTGTAQYAVMKEVMGSRLHSLHGGADHQNRGMTMEQKNMLILFPCDAATRQRLLRETEGYCICLFREDTWSREEYLQAMKNAHIIIGEPRNEDLDCCEHLELMHSPSSGVNYYVQGGKFPKGAVLCSMTGGYGNVLAEHMLAMVLSLCRRLPEYRDQQHQHKWELRRWDKQLEGSTLLVLGAGDIGTTLARWMRPMVGKIIGVRRVARDFPDCYDEMITLEQLDACLPEADIIVCALPHTPRTVQLLDERRLRLMKTDAVLVNGGRGSLIDQDALCRLLEEGRFWGVGLEVAYPEPLPGDHPLWDCPRLIITPHAAGNSFAPGSPLERKIWDFMIRNISGWLRGEPVRNQIDFSTGYRETQR